MRNKKLDLQDKIINSLWKKASYIIIDSYKGPSCKSINKILFESRNYKEALRWISDKKEIKVYYIYCNIQVNNYYCAAINSKNVILP